MKRVMLCGTFDLLHAGHVYVLKEAKKRGDYVIAVVARDSRVKKIKGSKSIHSEKERCELLRHIDLVDKVILGDTADVYRVIKKERPDIIVLGYDQHHFVDKLEDKLVEFGLQTKIVRLKPHKESTHKSGKIRKKILENL